MGNLNKFFDRFNFINAIRFGFLSLIRKTLNPDSYFAYSQTGEDIIISSILRKISNGFYIEIGSNEPIQHSNTFGLYQKGWLGITVDANSAMVEMHKKVRPKDISICAAVSDKEEEVIFYEFDMDEISTLDKEFYEKYKGRNKVVRQESVTTQTLDSIILNNLPPNVEIDLLSIDVEGHDYNVLSSIDLLKFRPKLIVIEMHNFDLMDPKSNNIYSKLIRNNYEFVGYAIWNGYFVANEYLKEYKI